MDFTACPTPCLPRPRRVEIDDGDAIAGFGERDQIVDGAAVLDDSAVACLRALDLGLFQEAVCDAIIGALARALDLGFETVRIERGEPLPARGFGLVDAEVRIILK